MRPALRTAAWSVSAALLAALPAVAADPRAAAPAVAPATPFDGRIAAAKAAMMSDPQRAYAEAEGARGLAGSDRGAAVRVATADWLRAEALTRMNRPAEALPVASAALAAAATHAPGAKLHGDLLMTVSTLQGVQGHAQIALSGFHRAHDIFRKLGEARSQAKALQSIGSVYNEARDFERTLKYYDEAAAVYAGDPALNVAAHNNRANALKELGRLDEAEVGYGLALAEARKMESPLLTVRILTNIASAQYAKGELGRADRTARQALALATGPADKWRPFVWGVLAQIALKRGDTAEAARLIRLTFQGQDLGATTLPFRDFHLAAHDLYARLGDAGAALAHFRAYDRLDDEVREASASVNASLMAARFDYNNQQLQISTLKAERLEKDVQLSEARQTFAVAAVAALALLLAVVLGAYLSVRRSRNAVRAANAELTDTNAALERALAARSQLLATTSHEIRTPLNGILGMTEVLLRDPSIGEGVREKLRVVKGSGATLRALVDDILDVAKMETGEIKLWRAETDVRALLTEVGDLWAAVARDKGLAFRLELDDCPEAAVTDGRRLRQIVFNLASNAVKFTDAGEVRLRAEAAEGADGPRFRVSVSDTGPGVPEAEHDRVFEAFTQVDGQIDRKHGGTGLGLAICRELARALGGEVRLTSRPGEGATFILDLPLERPDRTEAPQRLDAGPSGPDVLIVEPNLLTVSLLKAAVGDSVRMLERVDGPEAALAVLSARAFDAVVAGPGCSADPAVWAPLAAARPSATFVLVADGGIFAAPPFVRVVGRADLKSLRDAFQAAPPGGEGGIRLITAA